jgi:hypothetical protein
VRGQAFVDPRDVHLLCVIADGEDERTAALHARLEAWLAGPGAHFNAQLVSLNASDPAIEWTSYGVPSAPPTLPVVMLAGFDRANNRRFVIDHWEPAPGDEDLRLLATSVAREAIKREIVNHWAVLLYAPKACNADLRTGGESSSSHTAAIIDAVAANWAERHPPGVAVVLLDRTDPRERLLLSFIGLDPKGPDWVGIAFGRGKLMAPPLVGPQITEEALDTLLTQLTEICSCLRPPSMMGVDVPMTWEPERDKEIISLISPEAEKALAAAAAAAGREVDLPGAGGGILAATLAAFALAGVVISAATLVIARHRKKGPAVSCSKE